MSVFYVAFFLGGEVLHFNDTARANHGLARGGDVENLRL